MKSQHQIEAETVSQQVDRWLAAGNHITVIPNGVSAHPSYKGMKCCNSCNRDLPLDRYSINPKTESRYGSCDRCRKIQAEKRARLKANR